MTRWKQQQQNNFLHTPKQAVILFFCSLQQISVRAHAQNRCFQHPVGTNGKTTALNTASQKYISIKTSPKVAHTWGTPFDAMNKEALQL